MSDVIGPVDPVEYDSWTVTVSEEMVQDIQRMQCSFWLMMGIDTDPLTEEEARDGWRTRTHGDHDHTYAVGWRAEQQAREHEVKRAAEMAACPYVECTCGHHEERY